jgi:putative hydrolase of the HAD superfamily
MRRTVVFDFGAVLFRWRPAELLRTVLPEHAPDEARAGALAAQIFQGSGADGDWARFDLGTVDEGELCGRIARRTSLPEADVRRLVDAVPGHLQPQHEVVALFRALRSRGHRTAYLSNMPLPCALHLERENPFIAEFDDGIFSSRVGLLKPWPSMYALASRRFGLAPGDEVLFIDDHAGNVEAGIAHGWQGLRFQDAAQAQRELVSRGYLA